VLTGVGIGLVIARVYEPSPATRDATPTTSAAPQPRDIRPPPVETADTVSLPVRLTIPAIDVSTSLGRLALQPDQTVEVPSDPDQAGWYELGTRPGALGSAVILGHVDSTSGPAVFYRLSELRRGDRLSVGRLDGSIVHFKVTSVVTYANSLFPAQRVYATQGRKRLNLVTCGGDYDESNGGYQSNVVVYTRWDGPNRS
jgi:sortase (surface protein transpeptidase)